MSLNNNEAASGELGNRLPEGWERAGLGTLCEIIRGVSYKGGEAIDSPRVGYIPILRANNIGRGIVFEDLQYVPVARVSPAQILIPGDVVVAMSSGSKKVVGKADSFRGGWEGAFGAFCGVLRPYTPLEAEFFGLFFQTQYYRNWISSIAAGVNINNLKRGDFESITIPIPPLAEQQRIVAKVEELLARVNAARERLEKVPAIMKRFRRAVLAAACSGRLTEDLRAEHDGSNAIHEREDGPPVNWDLLLVKDVATVRSGNTPKGIKRYCKNCGEVPWYQVRDMNTPGNERFMYKSAAYLSHEDTSVLGLNVFPAGTIIFPKRGGAIGTDKKRLLTKPSSFDLNIMAVEPKSGIGPYLWWWFNSFELIKLADGSNVPQINHPDIALLEIPIPPEPERSEIVRRVEGLFALAAGVEEKVARARFAADRLKQAILAKAFRGELVPIEAELARREGRDYEPASALLARIKKEREESAPAPKKRKARR